MSATSVNREASRRIVIDAGLSDKYDQEADLESPVADSKVKEVQTERSRLISSIFSRLSSTRAYEQLSDAARATEKKALLIKASAEADLELLKKRLGEAVAQVSEQASAVGSKVILLEPTVSRFLEERAAVLRQVKQFVPEIHTRLKYIAPEALKRRTASVTDFVFTHRSGFRLKTFMAACAASFCKALPTWLRLVAGGFAFCLTPLPRVCYRVLSSLYRPQSGGSPSKTDYEEPEDVPPRLKVLSMNDARLIAMKFNASPVQPLEVGMGLTSAWERWVGLKTTSAEVLFTHHAEWPKTEWDRRLAHQRDVKLCTGKLDVAAFEYMDYLKCTKSVNICCLDSVNACVVKYATVDPKHVEEYCTRYVNFNNSLNVPADQAPAFAKGTVLLASLRIKQLQESNYLNSNAGNTVDFTSSVIDWVSSPTLETIFPAAISSLRGTFLTMLKRPAQVWQHLWAAAS